MQRDVFLAAGSAACSMHKRISGFSHQRKYTTRVKFSRNHCGTNVSNYQHVGSRLVTLCFKGSSVLGKVERRDDGDYGLLQFLSVHFPQLSQKLCQFRGCV